MKRNTLYGGFILLECVLWGLGNPVLKLTGGIIPPFTLIAFRFIVAFAFFMIFFGKRVIANLKGVRWPQTLAVCLFTALAFSLGTFALMYTDAVIAGFLMGLAVLFTPFLEPLLLRKRFNWKIVPLVLIVCVGMYLLCGGGAFSFGIGELLAILCSLAFAIMLTLSEKYVGDMDTITLSTLQCGVAGILGIILALAFDGMYDFTQMTAEGAFGVLYLALGSTCLAYVLQNKAMRHIPATFASLAFCTEPVFTTLFSYLLLGERLQGMGFVGAGIILAGVMAASVIGARE